MPYAIAVRVQSTIGCRLYKILRVFDNGETLAQVARQADKVCEEFGYNPSSAIIVYSD